MTCRSIVILTQIHKQSQLKVVFLSFYFAWITFLVKSFLIKDVEIPGFCSLPAYIADEKERNSVVDNYIYYVNVAVVGVWFSGIIYTFINFAYLLQNISWLVKKYLQSC